MKNLQIKNSKNSNKSGFSFQENPREQALRFLFKLVFIITPLRGERNPSLLFYNTVTTELQEDKCLLLNDIL